MENKENNPPNTSPETDPDQGANDGTVKTVEIIADKSMDDEPIERNPEKSVDREKVAESEDKLDESNSNVKVAVEREPSPEVIDLSSDEEVKPAKRATKRSSQQAHVTQAKFSKLLSEWKSKSVSARNESDDGWPLFGLADKTGDKCKDDGKLASSNVVQLSSDDEDQHEVLPVHRAGTRNRRSQPSDVTQKEFAKVLESYPIIYDPDHKDRKIIGAITAAYKAIGDKLILSESAVKKRWYRIRDGPKTAPYLAFMEKLEPSKSAGPTKGSVGESSKTDEDLSNDADVDLSTTGSSDGNGNGNDTRDFSEPSESDKMDGPAYFSDYKNAWDMPNYLFNVYMTEALVCLSGENARKTKKRIVKVFKKADDAEYQQ